MATTKPPQTKPGKLSEVARHVVVPSGITSTGWPAVRDRCAGFGVQFDPWQDGAGRIILAKRADGLYACSIGGVVISIPRQVGKTYLVGAIVFALCLLHPGLTVIWTAHRLKTAAETFSSMQSFAKRKKVKPHVSKTVLGSGDEAIEFHNGSRILFGARERGFGRGFSNVGVLVLDEAQIMSEKTIDDMVPAMNTAPNPILLMMGTPPKPTDPSEVFSGRRADALSGESDDMAYIEFSAERGCKPIDRSQWAVANPSYPARTPAASILRMKKNLSPESFVREALGVWDEDTASAIDMKAWALRDVDKGQEVPRPTPVALSIEVSEDRKWSVIGLAGMREDGTRHLQVVQSKEGTGWVLERVTELVKKWDPVAVTLNPSGAAGALVADFTTTKIDLRLLTAREMGQATGMVLDGITEDTIRHSSQPVLNIAAKAAELRKMSGTNVWHQGETDISPLRAVSWALFALMSAPPKKKYGAAGF